MLKKKRTWDDREAAALIWSKKTIPQGCVILSHPSQTAFVCPPPCEACKSSTAGVNGEQWVFKAMFLVDELDENCKRCGLALKCLSGNLKHKETSIFACLKCMRIQVVSLFPVG